MTAITDESARLEAIRRYDVLDTPPDGSFDRITALAAEIFDVPIALVTIVDHERIWFKSKHGLDGVDQIDRDPGLCASAVLQDQPYIVEEARTDPRTLANPLVAGKFGLQFYAAAPLRTATGHRLGTLCIIDREPRMFSPRQADVLQRLSEIVVDELELRLSALNAIRTAGEHQAQPPSR
ncbi:MAG: phosphoserine phosphatase RsbU/P [Candidatus Eremiobacteraeota bacterium]|jgi:GAF domain-containing protein|nr:phosphoserine phosphatase RsbU/P [Candidatus Eremiobacteraeota bacterium]